MNIFTPHSYNTELNAKALDDKRLSKMILETAQMLCTCIRHKYMHLLSEDEQALLYKSTHDNHPCNAWVRGCDMNFRWLTRLFRAYSGEYEYRFNKTHASYVKLYDIFRDIVFELEVRASAGDTATPLPNCTPYKDKPTHIAYMMTLCDKWESDEREPVWTQYE